MGGRGRRQRIAAGPSAWVLRASGVAGTARRRGFGADYALLQRDVRAGVRRCAGRDQKWQSGNQIWLLQEARVADRDASFLTVGYKRSRSVTVAFKAVRFVVEYGRTCDELGEGVEIDEYAQHVGVSRTEGFRRQAAFRKCFPKDDPEYIWSSIFKPLLRGSSFEMENAVAASVYCASLKCKFAEI
jgi:hypothetical protein